MSKNKSEINLLFVLILVFLIFILGRVGQHELIIFSSLICSIILHYYSKMNLYLFFIIVFLSNGFIPRESYIFGNIGVHQVVTIVTLFSLLSSKMKNKKDENNNVKLAKRYVWFVFFYTAISGLKFLYFGLFDYTVVSFSFRIVNFFLLIITFILVISKIGDDYAKMKTIVNSVILFYSITTIISYFFVDMSYYTSALEADEGIRFSGFIGNGDSNTLASVLVMGIAYILINLEFSQNNIYNTLNILFAIIAIGMSGSRNGLISLALILLLFIFSKNQIKYFKRNVFLLIFFSFFSFAFLSQNIQRLEGSIEEQQYTEGSTSNRVGKWIFYIDYFLSEPDTFLVGGKEELRVGWNGQFLVAHNFFIQIVYGSGIFMLIYLLSILWRNIKLLNFWVSNIYLLFFPFILCIVFVSDYGSILFYSLFLTAIKPIYKQPNTIVYAQ